MRSAPVKTYDPSQVSVIVGGQTLEGYAPDTFVEVSRDNDMWEKTTGCDGITARSKKNDKTGKIVVTLMHTSPSNDYLSALALADELSNTGLVPSGVEDHMGNTVCFALESWVAKPADVSFGSGIGTRQWTIMTGDMDMTVGGAA
jgi:hypothetical protein